MALALVEAVKTTPYIGITRLEAAKVAIRIEFSSKCGYKILHILLFGTCAAVVISTSFNKGGSRHNDAHILGVASFNQWSKQ